MKNIKPHFVKSEEYYSSKFRNGEKTIKIIFKIANMVKLIKLSLIISVVLFFTSCATSMTPIAVNNALPTLTKSRFISRAQAEEAISANKCKYLVKGRNLLHLWGFP